MTPKERYSKVKEIFLEIAKLTKTEQQKYLNQLCASDITLVEDVKKLLLAEEQHKQSFNQTLQSAINPLLNIEHTPLTPGLIINNRYEVESELGRGGFSIVYLAKDLQLGSRYVVIKIMLGTINHKANHNWRESKFFTEIKALSKINHPNVVAIYDYGLLSNNKPFFVMELILGDSLRKLISRARMGLPTKQALRIIKQIGNALSAVHQLGIYHRDLKPENIMVRPLEDDEEHIEIIDFGIATVKESVTAITHTNSAAGTPVYMAPEQFDGDPSARSDIYAMGVIAYELLTGRPPFNISNYKSLQDIINNLRRMQKKHLMLKPSELNPGFSEEVDQVLLKALCFDPQNRYKQANEFVKALSKALEKTEPDKICWDKLCLMAQSTDKIWFVNEVIRKNFKINGLTALYETIPNSYPLNSHLSMVLNIESSGHLLLIVKDSQSDTLCLCPSRYSTNSELNALPILLPTEGLINNSLPLSKTRGRKQVVAVVSQHRLDIDLAWPKATMAAPAQTVTSSDIYTLVSKLEKMPANSWFAVYSYVDIV